LWQTSASQSFIFLELREAYPNILELRKWPQIPRLIAAKVKLAGVNKHKYFK